MPKISVVVPVYNEEKTVAELHRRIVDAMKHQSDSYEIIFIDDGSSDGTVEAAKNLKPLKLISLQRNYGQTPALDVGIYYASGEITVFIDADLQNNPADIPKILNKLSDDCDAVIGWRQNRKDTLSRLMFSRIANAIARFLLGIKIHDFGCGLKAYKSKFIKNFRLWGEAQVFLPAVAHERGAKICEIPIAHYIRTTGKSKIGILKMTRGALDLFSIVFFVKYFSKPLRFFGGWGAVSVVLAMAAFTWSIYLKLIGSKNFSDTPLPLAGTLFAILGVILFMMGLLAEMILRIYYQKPENSPYVIKEIKEQK